MTKHAQVTQNNKLNFFADEYQSFLYIDAIILMGMARHA